jgi:hypothetical protein
VPNCLRITRDHFAISSTGAANLPTWLSPVSKLRRVFYFPWCGLCARFARAATCRYLRPYFLMRIIHLKPQPVVSCLWAIYEAARLRARPGEPVLLPKKERPGLDDVRRWHRAPSEKLKFGDREGEASSRLHLSKSNPCTFRTMR